MTVKDVRDPTSRTISDRRPAEPPGPRERIRTVGREGAFKDRPLWRRLQTIHHEIKEGRFPNTSSLAAELSVSTKTVQRDLDYLRDELEAPIEFRREENGYAYSRDDYVLPFLPVDGADLFAIGVAAQVLQLLGGTPLAQTLSSCYERLARLMPPSVRLRPEIVREMLTLRSVAFRPVPEETWLAVSEALQRGVALSIQYRHPGESPGEPRTIRPYALVLAGRDWMMLAEDQSQIKNFYLGRIASARVTSERYAIPKDFDADAFFRNTFGIFVGKGPRVPFPRPLLSRGLRRDPGDGVAPEAEDRDGCRRPGDPGASGGSAARGPAVHPRLRPARRGALAARAGRGDAGGGQRPGEDLWRRVGGSARTAATTSGNRKKSGSARRS